VISHSGIGVLIIATGEGDPLHDTGLEDCLNEARRRGGRLINQDRQNPCAVFADVRIAAAAGLAMLAAISRGAQAAQGRNLPRLGLHVAPALAASSDAVDPVALAIARQMSRLADPGCLVMSIEAREHVVASMDVELCDLGDRVDPVLPGTVRGFSASKPEDIAPVGLQPDGQRELRPVIAVIPFTTHSSDPASAYLGDILADEVILSLSRSIEVGVISRLSTAALRSRNLKPRQIHALVDATYLVSGSCYVQGTRCQVTIELTDARSGQVLWVESLTSGIGDALVKGGVVETLVHKIKATIMLTESSLSRQSPMEGLSDCTLLMGAVTMMHQLTPARFALSGNMLDALIARVPGHAAPHAWYGMFLLLRVSQGWSSNVDADTAAAADCTKRALDLDSENSLALAVDAHVHTQFLKDFDGAAHRLTLALESNPSNSLAWLFKCTMHAFQGHGTDAMEAADSAMRLSPLDPRRWLYDSLVSTAALGATDYDQAIMLAQRSIRANATHASSFRALAIAQALSGRLEEARKTVASLMHIQPGLTASAYRARHPSGASALGSLWSDALRSAGVPE
jgi:adenylate cyclase